MKRVTASLVPPGGYTTMMRTGFVGNVWAAAGSASAAASSRNARLEGMEAA
jgi:hypothetical protein